MHVSFPIPKELESYIESQLQSGNYASAGEYFLALLQHDQRRKEAQAKLAGLLQEGLESETELVTPEYWQDLRRLILGSGQ
ncbi:MAG: type II toxin-antitoxin system ParD family antitoxin [Coleofasciculaceae cyanobacterium SM2_1_6]|nr:type II toxin-antitoxin system ParD family antitoxin [Coleofasciculaceae cyanobacterium SM2_1_6]